MATSPQEQDAALGAQLIANDKWLVTNLLAADGWASGTAEELLDGSAWRRFAQRLGALDERLRSALAPGDAATRADGYRYLCMLVRNAFDVAIEDIDRDRPRITWLTRRNKIGWDCPDALYGNVAIRADGVYRLTGTKGTVHFLGLQVMAGIRTIANGHADEWSADAGGRFELIVGGSPRPGNWLPLAPGADTIWMRQFFYDWDRETPAPLWIDRVDDGPPAAASGLLDPAFMARRLDGVATNVEANVELWLGTAAALRARYCNVFPKEVFGGTAMGAQAHQAAGTCAYRVAEDEALLLEVEAPRARYWSVDLCNFWLESLDYAHHQSSLNGHQAVVDADGVFRAVVAHRDPGVPNWLDPVGHSEGSMIYRWNLAETTPYPALRIVPLSEVRRHLPAATPVVTPAERAAVIERRRQGVRRRFARPA
ncbi:MAG: hypothetical protein ACRERC_15760 [Candidatus Binatia bacterium]